MCAYVHVCGIRLGKSKACLHSMAHTAEGRSSLPAASACCQTVDTLVAAECSLDRKGLCAFNAGINGHTACVQAERDEHDKLAVTHEGLEARHASKSDMCKKLEEKRAAKAELASQLSAEVEALKQECGGLRTQLSALQESHDR